MKYFEYIKAFLNLTPRDMVIVLLLAYIAINEYRAYENKSNDRIVIESIKDDRDRIYSISVNLYNKLEDCHNKSETQLKEFNSRIEKEKEEFKRLYLETDRQYSKQKTIDVKQDKIEKELKELL